MAFAMNSNSPLYPLIFFLISALLSFQSMRLIPRRSIGRVVLSWQAALVSFPSAVFAWTQAVVLSSGVEEPLMRILAAVFLLVLEASAATLGVYWIVFRKRWRIFEDQIGLIIYSLVLTVVTALALWAGDFSVTHWLWFERIFMLVIFPLLVPPVLFALEWRLASTPVPKIWKGKPILLICSGLLALGLLGLSGIF